MGMNFSRDEIASETAAAEGVDLGEMPTNSDEWPS